MNKNIINSKVVVFLGAGASAFLEKPLMKDFVDILLEDDNFNSDEKNIIETIVNTKGKDLEIILNEIDGICGRDYFKGASPRNYFKNYFDANPQTNLAKFLLNSNPNLEAPLPSDSKFGSRYDELCGKCLSLRWKIYDVIFTTYYNVDDIKVMNLYKPFVDILEKKFNEKKKIIPIFTTNYDKSIEKFCELDDRIELVDGFEYIKKSKINEWSNKIFEDFRPAIKRLNICFFKLHGSIFWYRINKKIVYSHIVTSFPVDQHTEPVILYPNNTKEIIFDPFITSYCYLQKCFDNAEFIIFIGYSFRDYITITFLKSALRLNNKLKVAIIDPEATKLCKKQFDYYKKNFLCIDKNFSGQVEDYKDSLSKFLGL